MEFHYEYITPDYLLVNLSYLQQIDAFTFTKQMLPHAKMIQTYSQVGIYCPILPPNNMPQDKTLVYPYKNFDLDFKEVSYWIDCMRVQTMNKPTIVFVQIPDEKYLRMKENAKDLENKTLQTEPMEAID